MDRDIYEINRAYLLKARELALSNGDHRAHYAMGISMDLAGFLRRVSLAQVNALAAAEISCFAMRIPASVLRQVEFMTTPEGLDPFGKCQIIAGTLMREGHENRE